MARVTTFDRLYPPAASETACVLLPLAELVKSLLPGLLHQGISRHRKCSESEPAATQPRTMTQPGTVGKR